MQFPITWSSEGQKIDALIFQNRFKLYRARNTEKTAKVSEEECFGVLYYQPTPQFTGLSDGRKNGRNKLTALNGVVGVINEIIPPVLSRHWALIVIELLEKNMFRPTYLSCLGIENELRARGYKGQSICSFNIADAIGFQIMKIVTPLSITDIEELAAVDGRITSYLKKRGFRWSADISNWKNADGALWNRHSESWTMPLAPFSNFRSRNLKH